MGGAEPPRRIAEPPGSGKLRPRGDRGPAAAGVLRRSRGAGDRGARRRPGGLHRPAQRTMDSSGPRARSTRRWSRRH